MSRKRKGEKRGGFIFQIKKLRKRGVRSFGLNFTPTWKALQIALTGVHCIVPAEGQLLAEKERRASGTL